MNFERPEDAAGLKRVCQDWGALQYCERVYGRNVRWRKQEKISQISTSQFAQFLPGRL